MVPLSDSSRSPWWLIGLALPFFWMMNSLASRLAIEMVSSTLAVALRCGALAFIGVIGLLLIREFGSARSWKSAFVLGALQFMCMYLSTAAVQYTTVSRTSFFSSLFIFVVPVLRWGFYRARYTWQLWPMLAVAGFGVVATSGGLKLSMNKGDFFALLAAVMMAIFVVRLERLAREVPATQLAHMLGISLFGWSLLEVARSGIGRGFGFLRADSLTTLWQAGGVGTDVYSANATLSLGQLALLGFVLVIAVWTGGAWLASQAQARAQAVLAPHTVSILMVLGVPLTSLSASVVFDEPLALGDVLGLLALVSAAVMAQKVRERTGVVVVSAEVADVVEVPLTTQVMVEVSPELRQFTGAPRPKLHELDEPSESLMHVAQEGEDEAANQSDEQDPWSPP
ncbi:MAG: DMT family transporter [Myxococcota bacterium]|nr:DMT family transporter [Myxococcota bacterium]